MKTTVELPDGLLREAKAYAAKRGITLKQVFVMGVEGVVREKAAVKKPFKMKKLKTFTGKPLIDLSNWDKVRDLIYENEGAGLGRR